MDGVDTARIVEGASLGEGSKGPTARDCPSGCSRCACSARLDREAAHGESWTRSRLRRNRFSLAFRSDRSRRWGSDHVSRDSSVEGGVGVVAGRWVGALVSCALLLAACSSGDDAAPERQLDDAYTTAVETIDGDLPVVEPSTTLDVDDELASDFTANDRRSGRRRRGCSVRGRRPGDRRLLGLPCRDAELRSGDARGHSGRPDAGGQRRAGSTEWNAAGYTVIDRDQFRYVIESVELSDDLRRATVTVCFADGSKLDRPRRRPGRRGPDRRWARSSRGARHGTCGSTTTAFGVRTTHP